MDKLILRLETSESGQGIYEHCYELAIDTSAHKLQRNNQKRNPTPYNDDDLYPHWANRPRGNNEFWIFGFQNYRQFKKWFCRKEKYGVLDERGVVLSVYKTDPNTTFGSKHQAFFNKNSATRLGYLRLTEIPQKGGYRKIIKKVLKTKGGSA